MKKLTGSLLIVGAPEKTPDLLYATGFSAVDPVVYLQNARRRYLVVPFLEAGRAARQVKKGIRVLTPGDLIRRRGAARLRENWVLALLRKTQTRRVLVPDYFPVGLAQRIRRKGFQVRVARAAVFPGRLVKSADEIRRIQRAQRAAVRAMRRAVALIRRADIMPDGRLAFEGRVLTSERVRREIDVALLERDCAAGDTIVAGGTQGADPHERGSGPLHTGEPIVIDIFPRSRADGYWGDLTRTVVRGRAGAEVRRMFRAVKRAQAAALRKVRAGAAAASIHREVRRVFETLGFRTEWLGAHSQGFLHNTGHGLGLEVHEDPVLGEGPGRLRAGHVVTVEPGLYYRRVGGVRIEDPVLVTPEGPRLLASCPSYFELRR